MSPQEGIDLSAGMSLLLRLDVVVLLLRLRNTVNLWRGSLVAVLLRDELTLLGSFQPIVTQLVLLEFKLLGEQLLAVDELQVVLLLLVDLLGDLNLGWGWLRLVAVQRTLLLKLIQRYQLGLLMLDWVVHVRLNAVVQPEVTIALRQLLVQGCVVLAGLRVVHKLSLVDGVVGDLFWSRGRDGFRWSG